MRKLFLIILILPVIISCEKLSSTQNRIEIDRSLENLSINKEFWGDINGDSVYLYTLTNEEGIEAQITNYGGIIVSVNAPDKNGNYNDVALGFNTLEEYLEKNGPNFGCLIGRYANRIANGKFNLEGKTYELEVNSGQHHIHGGSNAFDTKVWQSNSFKNIEGVGIKLNYVSDDGEAGYPGKLDIEVTYTLTRDNEIMIEYEAVTDKTTIVNLTNHSYFNLAGHDAGKILDHQVMINAAQFTPIDETLIPNGEITTLENTPLDFSEFHSIGERIEADHPQIKRANGYDHNYIIRGNEGSLRTAAKVFDPESMRMLEVYTTEPGMQFYTGNFLSGITGKDGAQYQKRDGFAMEAQHYPNSPNQENFPSAVLKPGETYRQTTIYRFTIKKNDPS